MIRDICWLCITRVGSYTQTVSGTEMPYPVDSPLPDLPKENSVGYYPTGPGSCSCGRRGHITKPPRRLNANSDKERQNDELYNREWRLRLRRCNGLASLSWLCSSSRREGSTARFQPTAAAPSTAAARVHANLGAAQGCRAGRRGAAGRVSLHAALLAPARPSPG